jgi:CarboxypepD_reg-like domain
MLYSELRSIILNNYLIMLKLKYLFIVCFSIWSGSLYAQSIVRGKIIDAETKLPVPYMFVYYLKNHAINTYSDSLGNFVFQANNKITDDSIALSCVGYIKSKFILDSNKDNILAVKQEVKTLNEVVVSYKKNSKTYFIGAAKKILSFGGLCNNTRTGIIVANAMTTPVQYSTVTISKIGIFLDSKGDAPFRLRIFSKNTITFKPDGDILNESILLQPYKSGWNTIDLAKPITIKDREWFLGIEMLPNKDKNKAQCFGHIKSTNNSFFTIQGTGSWARMNFGKPVELMIRAGVQFD